MSRAQSQRAGAEESNSAAGALAPGLFSLICCLRMADALNTTTRRGEIGTSTPVFGLRPGRCFFLRTRNDPNDESLTVSPFASVSVISLSNNSTKANDPDRDKPAFW